MAGLNKVLLIGNVGGDPEIRVLQSGTRVANFSLATTESYTDKTGQRQSQTEWHRVEVWDGLAKVAEQYVKKGTQLYIEGRIRTERWQDKNGQERSGVRIRATTLQMLGGKPDGGTSNSQETTLHASTAPKTPVISTQQKAENPAAEMSSTGEDDLPF